MSTINSLQGSKMVRVSQQRATETKCLETDKYLLPHAKLDQTSPKFAPNIRVVENCWGEDGDRSWQLLRSHVSV